MASFVPAIYTSYFANWRAFPETMTTISIAGKAPEDYYGLEYKKLAPKWAFFNDYKKGILDEDGYTDCYYDQVLSKLTPEQVYEELTKDLGTDVIMLCWEKAGAFCHRRIVAEWLEKGLAIKVLELDKHKTPWIDSPMRTKI